jgi:hypothetical protein
MRSLGDLKTLSEATWGQINFHSVISDVTSLFHSVDVHIDLAAAMEGKWFLSLNPVDCAS